MENIIENIKPIKLSDVISQLDNTTLLIDYDEDANKWKNCCFEITEEDGDLKICMLDAGGNQHKPHDTRCRCAETIISGSSDFHIIIYQYLVKHKEDHLLTECKVTECKVTECKKIKHTLTIAKVKLLDQWYFTFNIRHNDDSNKDRNLCLFEHNTTGGGGREID